MKRIQLEPWTPYDKLSLASAVLRTGDQNWNAVARVTRNIFEENTKYLIEEKRSQDWFSNKQCAAQYEALLKNIGPRRKKKTEKTGSEHVGDSPNDIIISAVRQECIEELKRSLATTQALYLKLHKESEDIQAGRLDHKLEEMLEEYDAKEREKEIKMKLKFKLGEKNPEIMENNVIIKVEDHEIKKPPEKELPTSEPAKTNLTTSPLLTSLLQSPSPLTRPSLPPNTSPTISLLLNSSPSVPSTDSPTLSKLLEATNSVIGSPMVSINSTATPQISLKQDTISTVPSTPTVSLPSQQPSISQAPTLISTPSTPTVLPSPSPTITTSLTVLSDQQTLSTTTVTTLTTTSVTSSITTLSSSTPIMSTATVSSTITVESPAVDKAQVPSPSIVEESEQGTVETAVKSVDSSEITKIPDENKANINENAEVENRSTPEIVLEDLVHSVVESEVVIDQETPNKKRNIVARKLQVELDEAEDEVMETVEEIIEKVEEAIIETVGEGSTEIDLVLNQSSETDNLSDNIETLELDSHAVKLIVLGHDQASRINIRHDTEIASTPDKNDRSTDDVVAQDETDHLDVVENIIEEEVSTSEEKVSEANEIVEDEVTEIKSPEEIVEHEEIIENKESEPAEIVESEDTAAELATNKVFEEKNEEITVKDDEVSVTEEEVVEKSEVNEEEKLSLNEAVEEVEVKSTEESPMMKSPSETSVPEKIIEVNKQVTNVDQKRDDDVIAPSETIITSIKEEAEDEEDDENLCVEEEQIEEEEAIVEEAPEEVVIAELLEEVIQADKTMKATEIESKLHETVSVEHISIKQDISEDYDVTIAMASEDPLKISDHEDGSLKKTDDEDLIMIKEEDVEIDAEKSDIIPVIQSNEKESTQKEDTTESKNLGRKSKILEENLTSSTNVEVAVNPIKIEKDDESGRNSESKPIQEIEKRRPGRKRYQLAGCGDSKPNSPAPSSHSMEDDKEYKAWKKSIMLVYNRLAAHKYASVFLKPITEADATGYRSVVLKPMDLTTIKRNIETGVIRSTVEFQRDMILMAQNAMIYNKVDSLVFKMAEDMLADMMSQMEVMVQALGDGVPLWGDSEEKLNTRGRASKLQLDEAGNSKRRSHLDDTPYRRRHHQQPHIEDSIKKRRINDDVISSNNKRRSEDNSNKRKSISEDITTKKKQSEESTTTAASSSSRKRQSTHIDDSYTKKKTNSDETPSSSVKRKYTDDSTSTSTKRKTDESTMKKVTTLDDTPVSSSSGKRRLQQQQNESSRKNDNVLYKRKSNIDESSNSSSTTSGRRKNTPADDTTHISSKRKVHVDETTPTNKRKRSSMVTTVEEPRSTLKRKRADVT